MSFPSSHAVNNFAIATMFAWYYRRWRYWFYAWAAVVALSRVFVGVHYPSDVAGGALIGTGVALAALALWQFVTRRWIPSLVVERAAPVAQ
jgi:undecaprenyl-diphosphatase